MSPCEDALEDDQGREASRQGLARHGGDTAWRPSARPRAGKPSSLAPAITSRRSRCPTGPCRSTAFGCPASSTGPPGRRTRRERLTELALRQGFRGIDTANQRRHYHEAAVGQAVAAAIAGGLVAREDLFLQTKFTFRRGQDHRLPYDPDGPHPGPGRAVVRQLARAPGHRGDRLLRAARPDPAVRPGPGRLGGLAGDGGASTTAAGPACSASATSPSNSSTACARGRASGPASSRTAATPPGAGTATSARSAPRTGWSTRASRC